MQTCQTVSAKGLRAITPGLRVAEQWASVWTGMPDDGSKAELLWMLEEIPASHFGVPSPAWAYLRFIVKKQPKACFRSQSELVGKDLVASGLAMISTWTDADLAYELDRSFRTLSRYRSALAGAGLIAFRDSPDRSRRVVAGDDRSEPLDAYGIDLRPLIARYEELRSIVRGFKTDKIQARRLRTDLTRAFNRIKELRAVIISDEGREIASSALAVVEAVRRRKDLDVVRMGLEQARSFVSQLEGLFDEQVSTFSEPEPSGAPDTNDTQLLPRNPSKNYKKEGLGEGGTSPSEAPKRPLERLEQPSEPKSGFTHYADPLDNDFEAEGRLLFEFALPASPPLPPSKPVQRVTCPDVDSILRLLPALLESKLMSFSKDHPYRDEKTLALAYGQASASRLGFKPAEIQRLSHLHGLHFAVSALITEFSPGVQSPRSYLNGIVAKLICRYSKVDLAAGWSRLGRQYLSGDLKKPAPPREPSFASRRV